MGLRDLRARQHVGRRCGPCEAEQVARHEKVARTVYRGAYEGLADAWGEFLDWITANGHTVAPDLYQCYVAGPESSPDPANWRTELTKPLTS